MVTLRPSTTRIQPGEHIVLNYFVDTFYMDSVRRNKYDDSFTIIVENSSGEVIYKRTRYAGEGSVVLGPFTIERQDWVSIRAIDQDGCSSPTVFADFLVKANVPLNVFEITDDNKAEIYEEYGITEGHLQDQYTALTYGKTIEYIQENTADILAQQEAINTAAFRNKMGLTKLFFDKKAEGYNCVRLPENAYYEINYQRNIYLGEGRADSNNPMGTVRTSTARYYKVTFKEVDGATYYDTVDEITWEEFDYMCWTHLWNQNTAYPELAAQYIQDYNVNGYTGVIRYPNTIKENLTSERVLKTGADVPAANKEIPVAGTADGQERTFIKVDGDFRGKIDGYYYVVNN